MTFQVKLKKWGNSIGIVLPKTLVKKENLKENDNLNLDIVKEANLTNVFGSLKRKISGQEFKDIVRQGWGK